MVSTSGYEYQVGGSLPVDAPYVRRQADEDFYNGLKRGEFCYVLNARQMGKSSLRVRTAQRLQAEGVRCGWIDLTEIGTQDVTLERWYAGVFRALVSSFQLKSFKWRPWWREREMLSPVQRLGEFIEQKLLVELTSNLVIFVDEIDSILSLNFSTDDFFALIRSCYNKRVDNPNYKRLSFALLGVATPAELIVDKQRTPFNIGRGIELTGFTPEEAIPILSPGLASVVDNPEQILTEVLHWTGGQPFLTQKLCWLIQENSFALSSNGKGSERLASFVRSQILENWESKDQPEHLKTIRDRVIKRSEKRASYLLELYQRIWYQGEVEAHSTPEESELQLSGLIVNRRGKLRVYNPIYREVFNAQWIETELASLRPYAEAFRGWIASGQQDKSRLLRGKALEEAEAWAEGKELSFQDMQFLAASRQLKIQEEIEENQRQAQLEQERKDREAAEKRNLLLAEANQKVKQANKELIKANQKAKNLIRSNSIALAATLLAALGVFGFSAWKVNNANRELEQIMEITKKAYELIELKKELSDKGEREKTQEALGIAKHSFEVRQQALALLPGSISLTNELERLCLCLSLLVLGYTLRALAVAIKLNNDLDEELICDHYNSDL